MFQARSQLRVRVRRWRWRAGTCPARVDLADQLGGGASGSHAHTHLTRPFNWAQLRAGAANGLPRAPAESGRAQGRRGARGQAERRRGGEAARRRRRAQGRRAQGRAPRAERRRAERRRPCAESKGKEWKGKTLRNRQPAAAPVTCCGAAGCVCEPGRPLAPCECARAWPARARRARQRPKLFQARHLTRRVQVAPAPPIVCGALSMAAAGRESRRRHPRRPLWPLAQRPTGARPRPAAGAVPSLSLPVARAPPARPPTPRNNARAHLGAGAPLT